VLPREKLVLSKNKFVLPGEKFVLPGNKAGLLKNKQIKDGAVSKESGLAMTEIDASWTPS
jgi:hypothetical protein